MPSVQPVNVSLTTSEVTSPENVTNPQGYKRLYRFHKYWGKKPHEPLAFAIERLTNEGDTVVDPFVGSGIVARESLIRNRRFIGFDINPVAIELTKLMVSPPDYLRMRKAFHFVEQSLKTELQSSYRIRSGRIASHYLWAGDTLKKVWIRGRRGQPRQELNPTSDDYSLIQEYASYKSIHIRTPLFFSNSRINTNSDMVISDVLTGRAQYNLDLLLNCIDGLPADVKRPMKLCLTAASGQMSRMVFAITGRGKTIGRSSPRIEVGSWVIGYWRPTLHFEINVWNCFERRVSALLSALEVGDPLQGLQFCDSMESFNQRKASCYIECEPCQTGISRIKDKSVSLILTDPPHGDRIPYLELSELWNSILGSEVEFDSEIVVSNAKERGKTLSTYNQAMREVMKRLPTIMRDDAFLLMLYNARHKTFWSFVSQVIAKSDGLTFLGKFPSNYSATSVIQDNRKGSLKGDVMLVFGRPGADKQKIRELTTIPGWSTDEPAT